mmetsp:Transcript_7860/g.20396  ORF Transcript_7860/g.20396 Transcript_7860/m.20396 type:complete len:138 (-) Transcript_7860:2-415(-)
MTTSPNHRGRRHIMTTTPSPRLLFVLRGLVARRRRLRRGTGGSVGSRRSRRRFEVPVAEHEPGVGPAADDPRPGVAPGRDAQGFGPGRRRRLRRREASVLASQRRHGHAALGVDPALRHGSQRFFVVGQRHEFRPSI